MICWLIAAECYFLTSEVLLADKILRAGKMQSESIVEPLKSNILHQLVDKVA